MFKDTWTGSQGGPGSKQEPLHCQTAGLPPWANTASLNRVIYLPQATAIQKKIWSPVLRAGIDTGVPHLVMKSSLKARLNQTLSCNQQIHGGPGLQKSEPSRCSRKEPVE